MLWGKSLLGLVHGQGEHQESFQRLMGVQVLYLVLFRVSEDDFIAEEVGQALRCSKHDLITVGMNREQPQAGCLKRGKINQEKL